MDDLLRKIFLPFKRGWILIFLFLSIVVFALIIFWVVFIAHHDKFANRMTKKKSHKRNHKKHSRHKGSARVSVSHDNMIYGIHACQQAVLNPKRKVHEIFMSSKICFLDEYAYKDMIVNIPVHQLSNHEIGNLLPPDAVHQGIALKISPLEEISLDEALVNAQKNPKEKSCFVILDQVTDPHNIGAIMRSACAFGAEGIIVQDKNTPPLNATAIKIACGAAEHIPFIRETNLSRAIEQLQKAGYWCVGLDERGENSVENAVKGQKKITLVLGAEGSGLRKLVAQNCDELAKLPTVPPIYSLNVSNAAAVSLYEFLK